jgi:protein involved in temperature-dependent protein secretion
MDDLFRFFEAGEYERAHDLLRANPYGATPMGMSCAAFLLALVGRFDEADRLVAQTRMPMFEAIVRGERERHARWTDGDAACRLRTSAPAAETPLYTAMAYALLARDASRVAELKQTWAAPRRRGRLTLANGQYTSFADITDADDAIGRMLEIYPGDGLMYVPFARIRRIEILEARSFVEARMVRAHITDIEGRAGVALVPMLYATSATSPMAHVRAGRGTSFDYIGNGRRATGQRDFIVDGASPVGLARIRAIEFTA